MTRSIESLFEGPSVGRRALLLDFDGVIVDTEPLNFHAWNQAFGEAFGIFLVEEDRRQFVGLPLESTYQLWLRAYADAHPDRPPLTLSTEQKTQIFARKSELFFAAAAQQLAPLPGIVPLIQQARGLGWYVSVASRSLRYRVHRILEIVRMPVSFDSVLGYEDLVDPITQRKVHHRAAALFGIAPEACVVVEDSPSGVKDARDAGIGRVVGYTSTLDAAALYAAGAHEVVDDLHHLVLGTPSPVQKA
jgi:beta-phosphoglucomutase-like phosphatase (HAD superfamily)